MTIRIHSMPLGFDHCYLLQGDSIIMIDGGAPKQGQAFRKAIERFSIKPHDIQLIVLTHGHWDHIGSVQEIKEQTGAKIALHQEEVVWLEQSLKPLPPGSTMWGKVFVKIMALCMPLVHIPASKVDLVLGDAECSLAPYGIPGKIVSTPGHSRGSVSVVLETGEAFVGDMAMNQFPLRLSPGLPIFAENTKQLRESWKLLINVGVTTIYPAHGKPFSVEIIKRALAKWDRMLRA